MDVYGVILLNPDLVMGVRTILGTVHIKSSRRSTQIAVLPEWIPIRSLSRSSALCLILKVLILCSKARDIRAISLA